MKNRTKDENCSQQLIQISMFNVNPSVTDQRKTIFIFPYSMIRLINHNCVTQNAIARIINICI